MIVYKGAGPGTHWHQNDARLTGFTTTASSAVSPNSYVTHITGYSYPSPFISFSTSFAAAKNGYGLSGPGGLASNTNPGYVYEIDLLQLPKTHVFTIHNPLRELAKIGNSGIGHEHDGDQDLIEGVARNDNNILTTAVPQVGGYTAIPAVSKRLRAMIYAIRDAEVLLGQVPKNCVVKRHDVW